MIFSLILVIAIIYLLVFLAKKFQYGKIAVSEQEKLKIVSTSYIGNKKSLILVEVMDKVILLGVSGDRITTIARMNRKDKGEIQ